MLFFSFLFVDLPLFVEMSAVVEKLFVVVEVVVWLAFWRRW